MVTLPATAVEQSVAKEFGSIGEVSYVFAQWEDGGLSIWVAVDDWAPHVLHRVFGKQKEIINSFPDTGFSFNVIPDRGRGMKELLSPEEAQPVYIRLNERAIQG